MNIPVDAIRAAHTETREHEAISWAYWEGADYDFAGLVRRGAWASANHVATIPEGSWLNDWTLPHDTEVELRHDIEYGHTYDAGNGLHPEMCGKILKITGGDPGHHYYVHPMLIQGARQPLRMEDFIYGISAFNSAKLPDGQVIIFPWGNGTSTFLTEGQTALGIQGEITVTNELVIKMGESQQYTEDAFAQLPNGTIIETDDGLFAVLLSTHEDGPERRGLSLDRLSFYVVKNTIKQELMFASDLERDGLYYINPEDVVALHGCVELPTLLPDSTQVERDAIRPGDVIMFRNRYGTRTIFNVRWAGYAPGDVGRNIRGLRGDVDAAVGWSGAEALSPLESGSSTIYRVNHIPPPPEAIQLLEGAATPEMFEAAGIRIETTFIDENDCKRYLSLFTPEMVEHLKTAGITHVVPLWYVGPRRNQPLTGESPPNTLTTYIARLEVSREQSLDEASIASTNPDPTWGRNNPLWMVNPKWMGHDVYMTVNWTEAGSSPLAAYFPVEQCIEYALPPYYLRSSELEWHRHMLRTVLERAAAWATSAREGPLKDRVAQKRFQASLRRTFGIKEMLLNNHMMFGDRIMELREITRDEEPDVVILGRKYKFDRTVQVVDSKLSNFVALLDGTRAAAKKIIEDEVTVEVMNRAQRAHETILRPTEVRAIQILDQARRDFNNEKHEIEAVRATLSNDIKKVGTSVQRVGQLYDLAAGVMRSVIPPGWYVRVANGGYAEACIDKVTYRDATSQLKVTAQINLRVRMYWNSTTLRWETFTYIQGPWASCGMALHPHMMHSYIGESTRQIVFPELQPTDTDQPQIASFCFGAAASTIVLPSNNRVPEFMRMLKDYLFALNRLLVSVESREGYSRASSIVTQILVGYAECDENITEVFRRGGLTRQGANEQIDYANSLRRTLEPKFAELGLEMPPGRLDEVKNAAIDAA